MDKNCYDLFRDFNSFKPYIYEICTNLSTERLNQTNKVLQSRPVHSSTKEYRMIIQKLLKTIFTLGILVTITVPVAAKTLVHCFEGSPEGFDPALYTNATTLDATSRTIYNRLVKFRTNSTEIQSSLAQSWDVSEDGLEYTFNLRSGVMFQTTDYFEPEREFNADDVIFSIERQLKEDHPWYEYIAEATWDQFEEFSMAELIKEIERVDDRTVKFILNQADPSILTRLTMDFASILSKEYADSLEEDEKMENLNLEPVGTGPYEYGEFEQDTIIRFRAHKDYFDGVPEIDTVTFVIFPEATDRLERMKTNECHAMSYPNADEVEDIRVDENITLQEQKGFNVAYLAYNTKVAPFDKVEVRKALNMAINRQNIIDTVFEGAGEIAKNPLPPLMWSYKHDTQDDPFDPEAAKKALEDAGVSDLKMKILTTTDSFPFNPDPEKMAELIKADFAEVGVEVEIVSYDLDEFVSESMGEERESAVLYGHTGGNGDPDSILRTLLGCETVGNENVSQWCHEEYNNAVEDAKSQSDQNQKRELYNTAQTIFKEQAPWATIAHSIRYIPVSNKLTGDPLDLLGRLKFDDMNFIEEEE